MKAVMLMFDSLNRHMLPVYGCDWVKAPNFQRLAEKTVTFETSFVGSMPCMPARREIHTGRYNFLHRSWGPMEPFDDSMPEILRKNGVHTHLATDHYHYWEDGGATYHTRYSNFQISRGQEGDCWKGDIGDPDVPYANAETERNNHQDWVNRSYMQDEKDQPQAKTFALGLEYIDKNKDQDNWFLHMETFDPHEPYFSNQEFKDLYPFEDDSFKDDWPPYDPVDEKSDRVKHMRFQNAALITMCDKYLGKLMDKMDEYNLWEDTMLIINTDHGFLLGEHDWWAKCRMPFYNEIAWTPLFIYDPRNKIQGERRKSLVQTIDLAPTLLEYFGVDIPEDMEGKPLRGVIENDTPVREAALYGMHGGHVNVTDGQYVYMRAPKEKENLPLYNYTHMPTHMRGPFSVNEMRTAEMHPGFEFTKGCPVMKINAGGGKWSDPHSFGTMLFDNETDPKQQNPIDDPELEKKMIEHLVREMKANDAPPEQFERLGLSN